VASGELEKNGGTTVLVSFSRDGMIALPFFIVIRNRCFVNGYYYCILDPLKLCPEWLRGELEKNGGTTVLVSFLRDGMIALPIFIVIRNRSLVNGYYYCILDPITLCPEGLRAN